MTFHSVFACVQKQHDNFAMTEIFETIMATFFIDSAIRCAMIRPKLFYHFGVALKITNLEIILRSMSTVTLL